MIITPRIAGLTIIKRQRRKMRLFSQVKMRMFWQGGNRKHLQMGRITPAALM